MQNKRQIRLIHPLPKLNSFEHWFRHYQIVIFAALSSFSIHGTLLLNGTYRGTYDAFVHIFFADHYARDWFSLWETRWYTGFTMVGYPPLTHQLTALISMISSLPIGFIVVMTVSSTLTTIGVYRFSRLWVGHRPASYAAVLAVVSSSIAETIHVFGQLPTMFVMGVLLNALPFVWAWLENGHFSDALRGWSLVMVAAAGHHVTTLFGMVFFSGPIFATVLFNKFRTPRYNEPLHPNKISFQTLLMFVKWRFWRINPTVIRCAIFGVIMIMIIVFTVLPYWVWSSTDPITQISIPHGSRDNFLENRPVGLMFFLIPWGMLLVIFPYAIYKGFGSKNWILASSLALLSLLGTGGTTPIPAFLLRAAFYILTLDRFTFWATIVILPFAGQFVESLLHGNVGAWLAAHLGGAMRWVLTCGLAMAFIAMAIFTANLTQFRKFQPAPIDMQPIVEFLEKDNHDQWRYLTLGFGDQMAWLGAQTTALNVEGNYHSARRLPELTSTPVERLDGAKFTSIPGLGSLQQFVTNPQRYNLKYIFVNDAFYEPLLYFSGWHRLGNLDNDVQVWERSDVPPLPAEIPVKDYPNWQRLMWGLLPVGSIFVAVFIFSSTAFVGHYSERIHPLRWIILRWVFKRQWLHDLVFDDAKNLPERPSEDWQLWRRLRQFFPRLRFTPLAARTLYAVGLVIVILIISTLTFITYQEEQRSPEATLLKYYDALDFKRYAESYVYLDTPFTRDEYLRWLSLRGGLVASFGKLENLYMDIEVISDDEVIIQTTAEWVTAIGIYPEDLTYRLRKIDNDWRIVLNPEPLPPPRETFINAANTQFFIDLPLSDLDPLALNRNQLDRSVVSAGNVQIVYVPDVDISFVPELEGPDGAKLEEYRYQGLISVVGEVTNQDVYPSQITLSAVFRDSDGNRLAEAQAMDMMLHQLLPGESSPFRIDLVGAQAIELVDLDMIDSVEVIVKGTPTAFNLARPLSLLAENTLYNSSAILVDVPRILVTYRDTQETIVWVDGLFLERSIGPDETLEFDELSSPPDNLEIWPHIKIDIVGPKIGDWVSLSNLPPVSYLVFGYSR